MAELVHDLLFRSIDGTPELKLPCENGGFKAAASDANGPHCFEGRESLLLEGVWRSVQWGGSVFCSREGMQRGFFHVHGYRRVLVQIHVKLEKVAPKKMFCPSE